jgi:hypothetical protein
MFVVKRKKIVEVVTGITEEHWEYITGISRQWKIIQTSKFPTTALKFKTANAAKVWLGEVIGAGYGLNESNVRVEALVDERKDYGAKEIGDE